MTSLTIVIDKKCCKEKKVCIDNFEKNLIDRLSTYTVQFRYDCSPEDAFCEYGYTMLELANPSEGESLRVKSIIDEVFNNLERIRLDRESEASHDLNRLLNKPVRGNFLENIFLDAASDLK